MSALAFTEAAWLAILPTRRFRFIDRAMTDAFIELFPEVPIEVEGKVCQNWVEK
jgi:hypothetical protein